MKIIKLKRTFTEGLNNFKRNGWLSFATVSILSISLYVISATFILGLSLNMVLKSVQDKINVSVYFNSDVEQSRILEIKDRLVGYQEIKSIDYISKEKALDQFKKMSTENPSIQKALDEIGENPLLSSLVIKAKDPSQYQIIVSAISNSSYNQDISHIDYDQNKDAIQRLTTIMKIVRQVGLTLGIVFVFIGILITFNAIRLTMYSHKHEFEIMRLVGASNIYIRMPFVFEGIFYGAASAVIVAILLYFTIKFITPFFEKGLDFQTVMTYGISSFYWHNFFIIFGGLLVFGIFLGTISGAIAIRRYLKI